MVYAKLHLSDRVGLYCTSGCILAALVMRGFGCEAVCCKLSRLRIKFRLELALVPTAQAARYTTEDSKVTSEK